MARKVRSGYHHGNLREALVNAARRLIAARGPGGFTLVEAARLAGVSAAAPYRHFKDRDALLAEVARRGFAEFDGRLRAAWDGAAHDPDAAFLRMGEAYLAFARQEPGYYGAMFAARPPRPRGARAGAKTSGFGALEGAIAEVGEGDPRLLAYLVWALSHGVATLAAAGQLPSDPLLAPAALLHAGVGAMLAGAGRLPQPRRAPAPGEAGAAPAARPRRAARGPRRRPAR